MPLHTYTHTHTKRPRDLITALLHQDPSSMSSLWPPGHSRSHQPTFTLTKHTHTHPACSNAQVMARFLQLFPHFQTSPTCIDILRCHHWTGMRLVGCSLIIGLQSFPVSVICDFGSVQRALLLLANRWGSWGIFFGLTLLLCSYAHLFCLAVPCCTVFWLRWTIMSPSLLPHFALPYGQFNGNNFQVGCNFSFISICPHTSEESGS